MAAAALLDRLVMFNGARDNEAMADHKSHERLCHDLALLFSSTGLSSTRSLPPQSLVARSVLNYGLGNMAGVLVSNVDLKQLELRIRTLIQNFEPRIAIPGLTVQLLSGSGHHSRLEFLLTGEIHPRDSHGAFRLRSSWNTETGEVSVQPYGNDHG